MKINFAKLLYHFDCFLSTQNSKISTAKRFLLLFGQFQNIDGLIKTIFACDDYIKFTRSFGDKPINIPTSEGIEYMPNSSYIQLYGSPTNKKPAFWQVFLFVSGLLPNEPTQIRKDLLLCASLSYGELSCRRKCAPRNPPRSYERFLFVFTDAKPCLFEVGR